MSGERRERGEEGERREGERNEEWRACTHTHGVRVHGEHTHTHTGTHVCTYLTASVGEDNTWKEGGGFFFNTATNREGMLGQSPPSAKALTH